MLRRTPCCQLCINLVSRVPLLACPAVRKLAWLQDTAGQASSGTLNPISLGRCGYAAFLLGIVVLSGAAAAQEWTRFRGPNGSGQSEATTIPAAWAENDVLWKATLPGVGNSSPVLWGDRIFLTSADPQNGTRHVQCLSASDGKLIWKQDFPAKTHPIHLQNSLASSTPTVDGDHVYCAWATPEEFTLVALHHDGTTAWRVNLGPFVSKHGFGTSPILDGDLLIITNDQDADSFLIAVDRATGATRWKVPRKVHEEQSASYAAPCLFRPKKGPAELIVCSWAHGITSLEPASGKTIWEAAVLERRPVGSPIIVDGLILANCGEGSGNNSVVAIRPQEVPSQTPQLVYKIDKTSAPYVPSLVAKGDLVFLWGDRGVVTCVDAPTGKIHWRERVGGNYSSSPIRVNDHVFCISTDGDVVCLAASDHYEPLGKSSLGEGSRATPAVAGGRMFLRTDSHLVAVGEK
jgi:outer membrane protein assembly factor BamB